MEVNIHHPEFNEQLREAHQRSIQGCPNKDAPPQAHNEYGDACLFVSQAKKAIRIAQRNGNCCGL